MRAVRIFLAFLFAVGMVFGVAPAVSADHDETECAEGEKCEFPTPQECAEGEHNGYWDGGMEGRGAVCVGSGGQIALYIGGNGTVPCGVVIVANQNVVEAAMGGDASDWGSDPNECDE